MIKYWRLKRSDDELINFVYFLKSKYGYKESDERRLSFLPSEVSYMDSLGNPSKPNDTMVVDIRIGYVISTRVFSRGEYYENGEKIPLSISWYENKSVSLKPEMIGDFENVLRKIKLEKLNKINGNCKNSME